MRPDVGQARANPKPGSNGKTGISLLPILSPTKMTDIESATDNTQKPLLEVSNTDAASRRNRKANLLLRLGAVLSVVGLFSLASCYCCSSAIELRQGPSTGESSFQSSLQKHIKPIKPLHHGRFTYYSSADETGVMSYRREFIAPCGYGVLVFNVGPAAEFQPYSYEVYEDAYGYSNNQGLCFIYPSWKGSQDSNSPFWKMTDPSSGNVPLGDDPNRISSRVVIKPKTKEMDPTRGGDYLIVRQGDFYDPGYYRELQSMVHRLSASDNVEEKINEFIESM